MLRIGHGYDAHRLIEGRKLVLGGVEISHARGLDGHSDADVLLHAICDACLGAAGLGDIGRHFPPGSEEFRDIDSRVLLRKVMQMLKEKGLSIVNADATLIAQAPRLAPFIDQMQRNIGSDLGIDIDYVNIKATTTEGMGFAGREEGIAAHAVVLLQDPAA